MLKPIVDQILQNFESLKGKLLSYADRMCLIDYVFISSFVHSFMVLLLAGEFDKLYELCY